MWKHSTKHPAEVSENDSKIYLEVIMRKWLNLFLGESTLKVALVGGAGFISSFGLGV